MQVKLFRNVYLELLPKTLKEDGLFRRIQPFGQKLQFFFRNSSTAFGCGVLTPPDMQEDCTASFRVFFSFVLYSITMKLL